MAKVLIVDDEPNIRFVLRIAFEADGHTVVEAGDGKSALAAVAADRPDLVTTDFMMPVMDGAELIRELRENGDLDGVAILLVSSSPGAARVEGADDFMQKPLDPYEVVQRGLRLLEARS